MSQPEIKVGDKFFTFDDNRRVYNRDENGRAFGGPTFRGHFVEVEIARETRVSWVLKYCGTKVPKRDPWSVLYTPKMIDDAEWVDNHAISLGEHVRRCRDVDTLREVAALVGYEPPA